MTELHNARVAIRADHLNDEQSVLEAMMRNSSITLAQRQAIQQRAIDLVSELRRKDDAGLMEKFLGEYGLSTEEGLALMTLAEALLRVPDQQTVSDLIEDKIAGAAWAEHLGRSESALVNFSTRALLLTSAVLKEPAASDTGKGLRSAIKRLGEPVIRRAVKQAMVEMGNQFVLGETVDEAINNGMALQAKGYHYSYDMLGEAALTQADADGYFAAYKAAITKLSQSSKHEKSRDNPGISVKLSALHPRYESTQRLRVLKELVPRLSELARLARQSNMGFNIDAEEANRLDLSLDVIEAVFCDDALSGWDGFGVVVQAYGKRCAPVIDWLYALTLKFDRRMMVRLVKGAYWDSEIKQAQVLGLTEFPVYSYKQATDVAYLCCVKKLLDRTDRLYPQFATHNAHTVAAVLELASDYQSFEFQRLHGMGEQLHELVRKQCNTQCRIYAPVGAHRDLLAYLVRRLLENGANSSFVNQLTNKDIPAEDLATDPYLKVLQPQPCAATEKLAKPAELYGSSRRNSRGWDVTDERDAQQIEQAFEQYANTRWEAQPILAGPVTHERPIPIVNPAAFSQQVGTVAWADEQAVQTALTMAKPWSQATADERAAVLVAASDRLESQYAELFVLLTREAGKTPLDAIAELREAVDFLRFYALESQQFADRQACGIFACISPWNFPLAIFIGQIAAALAAGNAVIAKPADATPLVAYKAVQCLHAEGVPTSALQFLPGGADVGTAISSDTRIGGICFTGSTAVALSINRQMAGSAAPNAPLIAETGGINAMIVDSTALPEQAVRDIVVSAFQSAGQRCSALRVVCVQEDVAQDFRHMLDGMMAELVIGDPQNLATDVGPIINEAALVRLQHYVEICRQQGRRIQQLTLPENLQGHFMPPTIIDVDRFDQVDQEVFGPVLHFLSFKLSELDDLIDNINQSGYGLTFGLHTRMDTRVEQLIPRLSVGNAYVNRNQIGAVVGSQPFGGEGLSGTGPKAGGPHYLKRFLAPVFVRAEPVNEACSQAPAETENLQTQINEQQASAAVLETRTLPGPTGELNQWSLYPRGTVLCAGPGAELAKAQAALAQSAGCGTVEAARVSPEQFQNLTGIDAVVCCDSTDRLRRFREALAAREGPIIPLITHLDEIRDRCVLERHVCIDTTAAGGNATLMADY